ncbi:AAA-ATPase At2g18193-like [Chenopodium quinoa]|uniref:AAA+ ATPase domain-containing protein n=1 Tax=Chenopodium quinoa TaxID=63459 RepID=A0A803KYI7_CHEQI|nr:AAA-ATPase At2g18193-like [Chenopodium quinoa]
MMNSLTGIPSVASIFSAYATLSTFITLFHQAYIQFIPERVRDYIAEKLEQWFNNSRASPSSFTLVIEQSDDTPYRDNNQVFEACERYLCNKLISKFASRLKVSRPNADVSLKFKLAQGEQFTDTFEGKELVWHYIISSKENTNQQEEKPHFELVIEDKYKEVLNSYLHYILKLNDEMQENAKELNLHTLTIYSDWHSVEFKHPFTFDSLAMDPEVKKYITDDLDHFVKRKDFYKKVGKAWKRGYLLYGPPGTGKSSLIAAMANFLKFDIYDLQLGQVENDAILRNLMLRTSNKSMLVVEDIDCTLGLPSCRENLDGSSDNNEDYVRVNEHQTSKISLSGLLNFVDGLWSSCGDERIIIFTTNHKAKLDPALLRPGRMDVHIHMSYLTMPGFIILASNYLEIALNDEHPLFGEIETLFQTVNVTAAEISEELLRADDAETALRGVVQLLKKKHFERKESKGECKELEVIYNLMDT